MKKTTQSIIQEGSSRQSKTRQFMRQKIKEPAKRAWKRTKETAKTFGRFVFKHPKMALAATAVTLTLLFPIKTTAQEISSKTELVSDKEPSDKYRETKLKDGMITFEGVGTFDVRDAMKLINGTENVSEGTEKRKIENITLEGVGKGVYYLFEKGILGVFVSKDEKGVNRFAVATEGDELFIGDGQYYVSENGSIIATGSRTFVAITPDKGYRPTYLKLFGVDVPLENPSVSKGKDKLFVDLRDPTFEKVKLEFSIKNGSLKVVRDDGVIGGADQ